MSVFTQWSNLKESAREKRLTSVHASVELKRYEEPTLHDYLMMK